MSSCRRLRCASEASRGQTATRLSGHVKGFDLESNKFALMKKVVNRV